MSRVQKEYKAIDFPPLTEEQRQVLQRLDRMPDSEIDFSDIPPSSLNGNGGFYYMQGNDMSRPTDQLEIDSDNLEWLQKAGQDYKTRLNNVLRWARIHGCPIATL